MKMSLEKASSDEIDGSYGAYQRPHYSACKILACSVFAIYKAILVWTVQEALSARMKSVHCGSKSISWDKLIKAQDYILSQSQTIGVLRTHIAKLYFARTLNGEGPRSILRELRYPNGP